MRKTARSLGFLSVLALAVTAGAVYMDTNTVAVSGAGEGHAAVTVTSSTVPGGTVQYKITTPNFKAP